VTCARQSANLGTSFASRRTTSDYAMPIEASWARIQYDERVASYRQTVLAAFQKSRTSSRRSAC
jgi:hypothetical protein